MYIPLPFPPDEVFSAVVVTVTSWAFSEAVVVISEVPPSISKSLISSEPEAVSPEPAYTLKAIALTSSRYESLSVYVQPEDAVFQVDWVKL